jgi:hypothetical protein
LSHTIIRHAANAIVADSTAQVDLESCIIHGTAGAGLYARHAIVNARNCLIYDNGTNGVALTFGGTHRFDYCTIASFGNDATALALTNFYCPDPLCQQGIFVNKLDAVFRNTIIAGSSADEITLSDAEPSQDLFDVDLQNCIVQVRELLEPDAYPDFFTALCGNCLEYTFGDTLFAGIQEENFHLDTLSIAEHKAMPIPAILLDLDGRMRDAVMPDIGCYEYYVD